MQIDQTTLSDISIFHKDEEYSLFNKLNFTKTVGGTIELRKIFSTPHNNIKNIEGTQQVISQIKDQLDHWPTSISNGTILMIEKFLDYPLDPIDENPVTLNNLLYRWIHPSDFSVIKYTVPHFIDFLSGLQKISTLLQTDQAPASIQLPLKRMKALLNEGSLQKLAITNKTSLSTRQLLHYGGLLRDQYKHKVLELIDLYSLLDAWQSMAMACKKFNLHFPTFSNEESVFLEAEGLFHLLLENPVDYTIQLNDEHHFLFLTGANMAGKSTFIKSVGSAVFLAHIGMGVPAKSMKLCLFDGLLSNINVADNIVKGESYFYNEVQRIKNTITKIKDGKKWLILIDEIFKGTNVTDAMKCSLAVIQGLLKAKNSLFILSTHLYELGQELKSNSQISFRYFETQIKDDDMQFSYQLKEGISQDRIGYLILSKEGLLTMLNEI